MTMFVAMGTGRFTKDPELRQLPDRETCVCEFSLAVDETRKIKGETKKDVHFFDFVAWDKGAELICKYCKKGDEIQVLCTPRQDRWQDKVTGSGRSKVIYRVDKFSFVSGKARRNQENGETEAETEEDDEDTDF